LAGDHYSSKFGKLSDLSELNLLFLNDEAHFVIKVLFLINFMFKNYNLNALITFQLKDLQHLDTFSVYHLEY